MVLELFKTKKSSLKEADKPPESMAKLIGKYLLQITFGGFIIYYHAEIATYFSMEDAASLFFIKISGYAYLIWGVIQLAWLSIKTRNTEVL